MRELVPGIIGGMGPEATVDLMQKIIAHTSAIDDVDHVHCIIDNNPKIPSRIKAILGDGEDPGPVMADMGRKLEAYGADFLVIPCNTAHYYYNAVANAVNIPVVNMITLVVDTICTLSPAMEQIGILGSTTVIKTALYQKAFQEYGVEVLYPDEDIQAQLFELIKAVKRGKTGVDSRRTFAFIGEHLRKKGAEQAVLGCTELGIIAGENFPLPFFDAAELLALEVIAVAKRRKKPCVQKMLS